MALIAHLEYKSEFACGDGGRYGGMWLRILGVLCKTTV